MSANKHRQLILFVIGLSMTGLVLADEFRQWMQQQTEGVREQQRVFQQYRDERDRDFTAFLKKQWRAVDIEEGTTQSKAPKPDLVPVAPKLPGLQADDEIKTPVRVKVPELPLAASDPLPHMPPSVTDEIAGTELYFDFFGHQILLRYDADMGYRLMQEVDNEALGDFWSNTSQTDFESLIEQLSDVRESLQLNDWAYTLLLERVALEINDKRRNETKLLTWFLLIKSAYRARIAYDANGVYLLLPSRHEMFDVMFFTFGDVRYYVIETGADQAAPGRVFTYDGEYPRASRMMDMRVTSDVAAGDDIQRRHLSFQFDGETYNIEAAYDSQRIRFFETYPQLALDMYFDSGVYRVTATPLQQQLAVIIEGMSERQAADFLLRFVQTSLQYETDDKQFGKENYLFPEETIFYPYSDCEDRAVLFAWLVESLIGLDVIGLDYPGHVATAVSFSDEVKGDSIEFRGRRYIVADPTYVNARVGMTMPQFRQFRPTVVEY